MTGSEAITQVGRSITPHFNIDEEPRRSIYRQVYEKFIRGLKPEGVHEKGVLLIGGIGVGKSILMLVIQRLFKDTPRRFKKVTALELKDLLTEYTEADVKRIYGRELLMDLYIDDIGFEGGGYKRYGNDIHIVAELIFERYDLFLSHGYKTHFSSNLPLKVNKEKYPGVTDLTDMYGDRCTDRLREMCDTITWKGASLRK